MVRDFVVVHEVAVHRRCPTHHVLRDETEVQVAQQDIGHAAQCHVGEGPVSPRFDVLQPLPAGLVDLLDHLADREDERARQAVAVHEVGADAASRAASGPVWRPGCSSSDRLVGASPEKTLLRLTPPSASSPRPLDSLCSTSALSLGWLVTTRLADLLLVPAEGRHLAAGSVQKSGLAGRRRRGQLGVPLGQRVTARPDPAGQGRQVPGLHRPLQQRRRESVDLDEHDTGSVGGGRGSRDYREWCAEGGGGPRRDRRR